jgi:acyl carrier protein
MTRDQIIDLVKEHAADIIPGLDPTRIDFSRSLRDQGATSLNVVELVSVMMRQLRVKIARGDLAKISTLDGMVDLFVAATSQSVAPAGR